MAYMTEVLVEQSSSWTIMGVLLPQNGHGFKVLFAFLIAASNFDHVVYCGTAKDNSYSGNLLIRYI